MDMATTQIWIPPVPPPAAKNNNETSALGGGASATSYQNTLGTIEWSGLSHVGGAADL